LLVPLVRAMPGPDLCRIASSGRHGRSRSKPWSVPSRNAGTRSIPTPCAWH
jgi:hypothetical protein